MREAAAFGSEIVLGAMSMVPIGFRDLVDAAAGVGFDAVTVGGSVYHRSPTRDGLRDTDTRSPLADRGLAATDVGTPTTAEEATGAFARLCDRAAGAGLQVSLEFPAVAPARLAESLRSVLSAPTAAA